jgi:bisanhydrobacterioruberin hydratase
MAIRKSEKLNKYIINFLYAIFAVGAAGHLSGKTFHYAVLVTPFILLLTGIIILFFLFKQGEFKILIWLLLVYAFIYLMQVIGIRTGLIFGDYLFGERLGANYFGVPLIIGLNYTLVIFCAVFISKLAGNGKYLTALLAALLVIILDFQIEPAAVKLQYWEWHENIVPLKNYYTWFVIAFFSSLFFDKLKLEISNPVFLHFYLVQLLFFSVLTSFM